VSLPTITRRIEELQEAGLLDEQTRPRPDGHHDTVYMAQLDTVEITLTDGKYEFTLRRERRDPADELQKLWEKF